ncbi:MAG: type IV toxin-antitoxin system AbiEi family antitoxin domain-containing protein [Acidimicrobiales bacterium]
MTAFDIDRHAERLARTQHGVFSRRQIAAVGATRHMISGRLRNGRWIELSPSVYALPSHPGTWHRALMAAVLAERQAAVAGRAAAALHGLTGFRPGRAEIVVPTGRNHHPGDVLIHRSDAYRSTAVLAIPVLTVCDTLFVLAGLVERPRLQFALDDALAAGAIGVESLQSRYLSFEGSRRPGLPAMRQLIEERSDRAFVPPESVLEALLYAILDRPELPPYVRQPRLPWAPDRRADAGLVGAPVLLEADGRPWHTRVADFQRDRVRDRVASAHGFATLRFTHADLSRPADVTAAEILAVFRSFEALPQRLAG